MSHQSGALRATVMTAASFVDDNARFPSDVQTDTFSLFFYGTLVHPAILARMIGHGGTSLTVQPAILPGYVLHHVKGEEYPALVPWQESAKLQAAAAFTATTSAHGSAKHLSSKTPLSTSAVRGSLVKGLTEMDVRKLDLFEGDEYIRTAVEILADERVPALKADQVPRDQSIDQTLASLTSERINEILARRPTSSTSTHSCHVYKWHASTDMLEAHIWTFETFMSSGNHTKWWQGG